MSSLTTPNVEHQDLDNSRITVNSSNSTLMMENNSTDLPISQFDNPAINPSNTLKTQVFPLVYTIQSHSKLPFGNVNKCTGSNNVMLNSIPQFKFTAINQDNVQHPITSPPLQNNTNIIFTSKKPQSLVIQKPVNSINVAAPKTPGTYVTMLQTVPNTTETLNKIQLPVPKLEENLIVDDNGFLKSANNSSKILLTSMPKLSSNRPPVTVTTNSVQPKITVLPMSVPTTESKNVFNFQISDGQISTNNSNTTPAVTVMCDNTWSSIHCESSLNMENKTEKSLVCDEEFNIESPEKNDLSNKSYELSIAEDSLSNQSDIRLVVSSIDSSSSNGDSKIVSLKTDKPKELAKFSHGISILKKNYTNSCERKLEKLIIDNNNSDLPVSEVSISNTVVKEEEQIVIPTVPTVPQPPAPRERKRKSSFTCRKDFDEIEMAFISEQSVEPPKIIKEEINCKKKELKDEDYENIRFDVIMRDDFDPQRILKWDDGIGILPGSTLKFIINEFNMIEYLTEEDYRDIIEKRLQKARERMKEELQEEVNCIECGCFGLRSDFINPKYCSYDCQESHVKNKKKDKEKEKGDEKKKKKRELRTRPEQGESKCEFRNEKDSGNEDDSNDASPEKYTYPWACKKKGFSWAKYLDHVKAKPAPVKLFKDPFPYTRNGFRSGMKLEGVDPQHPSYFCVLTVAEVIGYRVRMHFDGYPDNYDFWCNADSMDIFPAGWCEKYGHVLHPPPNYTVDNFNWVQYLKQTKSTAAPKHLFANRAGQAICPNGFRIGMKLEAVDKKNTSLICVASIRDMMDNRLLVHFDSWDDIYDYWADPTSPYIHPVGWCDQYGHNLTPPNDYPNPESFSWEVYLKETKSIAAPVRAFKQRPACGFRRGMRLECVDKRVPQLIRVATVDDVKEHQIRIHFDGWPDRYSYWVDDDSPDIHPVGWCQKTGHPMEPPLTPDDVYDFLECPTVGCKGQGHIKGPKYGTHSVQKHCPYAEENIDVDKILPDRLLSPDRSPQAVVPISREPKECKIKPRLGRPPKYLKRESKPDLTEEPPEKKPKRKYIKKRKLLNKSSSEEDKARSIIEESKVLPAERESWEKHSTFLKDFIDCSSDPCMWSCKNVIDFVSQIPGCDIRTDKFKENNIDGEAFLMLTQKDILSLLKLKVGPAVKLYNSIVLLREQFLD